MGKFSPLLLILFFFHNVIGHKTLLGSCPKVNPMEGFAMEKFLGLWYVTDIFDSKVHCMTWNVTQTGEKKWSIKEYKPKGNFYQTGTSPTGILAPSGSSPGSFQVKWSSNIAGAYDLTVFYTDYENVAGIFSCQGILLGQRQQGVILTRSPMTSSHFRQLAKGKLEKYHIEMYYFQEVDHSKCVSASDDKEDYSFGPLSGTKGSGLDRPYFA